MIEYFIIGFLVAIIFDSVTGILSYLNEWAKTAITVKITQCNSKISNEAKQQQQTNVIGFTTSDEQGDFYE